jgi:hypothetical protein
MQAGYWSVTQLPAGTRDSLAEPHAERYCDAAIDDVRAPPETGIRWR